MKVLITTSGIGSRLGDLTKNMNKCLVRVGDKPAISHVIDSYPQNTHFVVTLGYFGEQVKDFLKMAYPERFFEFVWIDKYQGPGSSLGYSMLQASKYLNEPFIFHASDTIVTEKKKVINSNWIGGFKGEGSSHYASFNILNNRIQRIMDKGILDPDFLHIGLIGIYDYKKFWNSLKEIYNSNPNFKELSDVHILNKMMDEGVEFGVLEFKTWYDTGNVEALHRARSYFGGNINVLDKADESIFIYDKFVIKYFSDINTVKKRVRRAKILKKIVPEIIADTQNFYKYKFVKGNVYSEVANGRNFEEFLKWSSKNLWIINKEVNDAEFKKICLEFYKEKTIQRTDKFLKSRLLKDKETIINDENIPSLKNILKMIDFDWLTDTEQTYFHGDFILDNIIKNKNKYILLDWRQDFGGLLKSGDKYYDLAKLNHNLIVNHEIILNNLFSVEVKDGKIYCDILMHSRLLECQKALFSFAIENNLNVKKIKILTALIWLNMSPLHHNPFDQFLFYFGKYNLWKAINEN